jgi:hypothetical protein
MSHIDPEQLLVFKAIQYSLFICGRPRGTDRVHRIFIAMISEQRFTRA